MKKLTAFVLAALMLLTIGCTSANDSNHANEAQPTAAVSTPTEEPISDHDRAMALIEAGDYEAAYALLEQIGDVETIAANKYDRALALIETGDFEAAYALLEDIGNEEAIAANKYDRAQALIETGDFEAAYALLEDIGNKEAIAANKYERANASIETGDYEAAYALLAGLHDYKDSADLLNHTKLQLQKKQLSSAKQGDIVCFGSYDQGTIAQSAEEIEWLVLAKKEDRILVISRYALECMPYNTPNLDITWKDCTLRKWLNEDFLNSAFTSEQKDLIVNSIATQDYEPIYNESTGEYETDNLFLLSLEQTALYFDGKEARQCKPTLYAQKQGAKRNHPEWCIWWLKSVSLYDYVNSKTVYNDNYVIIWDGGCYPIFDKDSYGGDVEKWESDSEWLFTGASVRPAMWITIDQDASADEATMSEAANIPTELIGRWGFIGAKDYIYYEFREDGTGKYRLIEDEMDFTYTVEDNTILICYKEFTSPKSHSYSFLQNGLLRIGDSLLSRSFKKE